MRETEFKEFQPCNFSLFQPLRRVQQRAKENHTHKQMVQLHQGSN